MAIACVACGADITRAIELLTDDDNDSDDAEHEDNDVGRLYDVLPRLLACVTAEGDTLDSEQRRVVTLLGPDVRTQAHTFLACSLQRMLSDPSCDDGDGDEADVSVLTALLRCGAWVLLTHPIIHLLVKGAKPQWQFTARQQLARRAYREGVRVQALLRKAMVIRADAHDGGDSQGPGARVSDVCLPVECVDKVYCAAGYCLPDSFE